MKKINLPFIALSLLLLFSYCKQNDQERENLLNNIPHIEDSLILDIPQVSRLCDNLDIKKDFVDIGNCKLYCEIEGEGVPLVLINGGPGGTHHSFHHYQSRSEPRSSSIYLRG